VQYAQGWLFGRPGSFDAIVARMASEAKADDTAALLAVGGL
jgi:EAL domain-containing protein (putative c-di-GMP-specific phosphodiesterase class I)